MSKAHEHNHLYFKKGFLEIFLRHLSVFLIIPSTSKTSGIRVVFKYQLLAISISRSIGNFVKFPCWDVFIRQNDFMAILSDSACAFWSLIIIITIEIPFTFNKQYKNNIVELFSFFFFFKCHILLEQKRLWNSKNSVFICELPWFIAEDSGVVSSWLFYGLKFWIILYLRLAVIQS